MPNGAPAEPDQPDSSIVTPLDRILSEHGVARSLPPELLKYARERDLRLEGEEEEESGDEPGTGSPAEGGDAPEAGTESFMDFNPETDIPEDADAAWLASRYGEMNKHFTQRMQEVGDGRRQAEESQALIEGLRDPETMPHYLRLLGVDLTNPEHLQQLGISVESATGELDDLLDDEPDAEARIDQLEALLVQQRQEDEQAAELQALDDLADQELGQIEQQWGRKLDDQEDTFVRFQAESNPGSDGLPDYEAAAKLLKGILTRNVELELKRRREEPGRGAPGGKPGGKALNPNKEEDRLALGAAAAERAMASQA